MDVEVVVSWLGARAAAIALWRWMEPECLWVYLGRFDRQGLVWSGGPLVSSIAEEFGGGSCRTRVALLPPLRFQGRPSIGPFFFEIAGPPKR